MSEKKYKQTHIPTITTLEINYKDRAKFIKEYYRENLQGKHIVNQHLGLRIYFTSAGKYELAYGRAPYLKKVAVIQCIAELLEVAEYNNFGIRKETDPKPVLGYLNFKAKVKIDSKMESVRISVLLKKDGKAYYNHEISTKK